MSALEIHCSWLVDPTTVPALWGTYGNEYEVQLWSADVMLLWVPAYGQPDGIRAMYPVPNEDGDLRLQRETWARSSVIHDDLADLLDKAAAYLLRSQDPGFNDSAWVKALPQADADPVRAGAIAWPESAGSC